MISRRTVNFINVVLVIGLLAILAVTILPLLGREVGKAELPEVMKGTGRPEKGGDRGFRKYGEITRLNIFGDKGLGPKPKPKPRPRPKPAPKPTPLKLQLLGIVLRSDSPDSAYIKNLKSRDQGEFREGDTITGTDARVKSIQRNRVILERHGEQETLELYDKQFAPVRADYSTAVEEVSDTFRKVRKERLESLAGADPVAFLAERKIGVKGNYVRGSRTRVNGYRVFDIGEGSLPALLGFRNNDIILTVNGRKIVSREVALEIYDRIKSARTVDVGVLREGKRINLHYEISP